MTTYYNAEFAAEHIVKRDPDGNWCEWGGSAYESLITGLNGTVYCMAEGPDGKIYVGGLFTDAGGTTDADYLARWNPVSEAWEAVGVPNTGTASITNIKSIVFDTSNNLYVGGDFTNFANIANADYFAKWDGSNWSALGSGIDAQINDIDISPDGIIYIGGAFSTAGGDTNCNRIAYYDTNTSNWKPLSTGLNQIVLSLSFAPNSDLYISGGFTDAAYPYLCKWNGSAFSPIGTAGDITQECYKIIFDNNGSLYAGGSFTDAGSIANADYIAKWNGSSWSALGTGLGGSVRDIKLFNNSNLIVCGLFPTAGGLTLTDRVAVWSNGAWQPLDIDLPGSAEIHSVLPASDGSLYIGGAFSTTDSSEDAVCGISYEVEVAEEIEEDFDAADLDPVDSTGV